MADKLTPQQQQAVSDRGGNLLVSAAAGSGKTKVLVDRLLSYLMDPVEPANIDDFLIITYTKAAAAELREKIANKLTEKIAENPGNRHLHRQLQRLYLTTISTVHSFCSDILRQYAYILDLPADFSVIDERDAMQLQAAAMEQVLEEAYSKEEPDADFLAFTESQGFHRNDRNIPPIIMDVSTKALCHLRPDEWLRRSILDSSVDGKTDASQTVWGKYLIDDLHEAVELEMKVFQRLIDRIRGEDAFAKPQIVLSDIYTQLHRLYEANTWDAVISAGNIEYGSLYFSKEARGTELAEQIKAIKASCKKHLDKKLEVFINDNHQVMEDLRSSTAAVRGLVHLVQEYHRIYGKLKRNMRALDFSDLEHYTLDLLYGKSRTGITSVAKEIAKRFRQIMVDEYQDSNAIQDAIFEALSRGKNNLFMVGDVKQSIYQFRLADPDIFLDKYTRYQNAGDAPAGEGRKVLLSSNFRSGNAVLSAVNDVFFQCMSEKVGGLNYGREEALSEGIPHVALPGPEIQLLGLQTKDESNYHEARMVAQQIRKMLDDGCMVRQGDGLRPATADDIVILLRSPGTQGPEYKAALESYGIPCDDDLESNLFDAQEIGVLRSLLAVISNPRQDIPLISVLVSPVFGYTADDLARLRGTDRIRTIYELLKRSDTPKAEYFFRVLSQLRKDAKVSTVAGLLERIYLHTSLDRIYTAMPDGKQRKERLEAFYALAVDFDERRRGDLEQFLENLDIMEEKGLSLQPSQQANCVRIISIHKSKGLEYPIVFLSSLAKRFNTKSIEQKVLLDKQLGIGLCCCDTENRICYPSIAKSAIAVKMQKELLSEEMRILYVAMTRPKDRLIMTYSFWKPETAFGDMALRMAYSDPVLLHSTAKSLSSWVLFAALQRTEAGQLFAMGSKPNATHIHDLIWDIQILTPTSQEIMVQIEKPAGYMQEADLASIRAALDFSYPYTGATQTPSKQTATQLKERYKDEEISANTRRMPSGHVWRKPTFVTGPVTATQRGNAVHAVMQYVDFRKCTEPSLLELELDRLVKAGLISQDQRAMVSPEQIVNLFASEVGQLLLKADRILREFKFSILYSPDSAGNPDDKILLQGVVDCAILAEDGIIIIDFKSDRVTADNLNEKNEQYFHQVNAYGQALSQIFDKPVLQKWLYYFNLNQGIRL